MLTIEAGDLQINNAINSKFRHSKKFKFTYDDAIHKFGTVIVC